MTQLCIADLNEIIGGHVALGVMPPLAGLSESIGRIVIDSREARPRDVLWVLARTWRDVGWRVNEAFAREALGVVAGERVEPWAGKFCLTVPDTLAALRRLLRCLSTRRGARGPLVFSDDLLTSRVLAAVRRNDEFALQDCMEELARPHALAA